MPNLNSSWFINPYSTHLRFYEDRCNFAACKEGHLDFAFLSTDMLGYLRDYKTGEPFRYNPRLSLKFTRREVLKIRQFHYTISYQQVQSWNKNPDFGVTSTKAGISFDDFIGNGVRIAHSPWFLKGWNTGGIPRYKLKKTETKAYLYWSELYKRVSTHFPYSADDWWRAFKEYAEFCFQMDWDNVNQSDMDGIVSGLNNAAERFSRDLLLLPLFCQNYFHASSLVALYKVCIHLIVFNSGLPPHATDTDLEFCKNYSDEEVFRRLKKCVLKLPTSQMLVYLGLTLF